METKTVSIDGFSIQSTWSYRYNNGDTYWYGPTSASPGSKKIEVDLSDIPAGSRVKSATLAARASRNESKAICNNVAVVVPASSPFSDIDVTGWFTLLTSKITIEFKYCDSSPFSSGSSRYSGSSSWFRSNVGDSGGPMVLTIVYELPNSTGTFNTSSVEAGASSSITLNITAINPEYSHTVAWKFYKQTYTHTLGNGVTSSTWDIPESFCDEIPNATSGSGEATLTTYSGGVPVGDPQKYTFTVTVPASIKPTASTLSASPIGTPDGWGTIYVQNFSRAHLVLPDVHTYHGSTVKSVVFSGGSWSANGTLSGSNYVADTGVITTKGTVKLQVVVTDSRDRTCTKTVNISVTAYSVPKITSTIVRRCTIDEYDNVSLSEVGTNALVTVNYSFASIGGKNHVMITSDYQVNNTGDFIPGPSLSGVTKTISSLTLGNKELSADSSHTIRVRVTDDVGNFVQTSVSMPTATYVLHFKDGGTSVAIGQAAVEDNSFTVNPSWNAYIGGINMKKAPLHLEYKRTLSEGENLNNILEYGMYGISSNDIAATITNVPIAKGGLLMVVGTQSEEHTKNLTTNTYCRTRQVYMSATTIDTYVRLVHTEATAGTENIVYGNWMKVAMGDMSASSITGTMGVDHGGTGATTAQGAASNLNFTQAIPYVDSAGNIVNTITLPRYSGFSGFITSSNTEFRCMIPVGRRINASNVAISGVGYLVSSSGKKILGGDNGVSISSMGTLNTVISADGFVGLCITSQDEFAGTNNTPAVLSVESLTLTFS